ncbi:YopX family protein [Campylobacter coli]
MKLKDFDFRIWSVKKEKYLDELYNNIISLSSDKSIKGYNRNYKILAIEFSPYDSIPLMNDEECFEIELFTGIYDKKGKKVYENDIVKVKSLYDYFLAKISIHKAGTFYFEGKNGDYIGSLIYLVEDEGYTIETIGNIHENKELLKG